MQLQCWRGKEDQCRARKIWRVFGQNLVNKHQPTTDPFSGTHFFSGKYCCPWVRRDRLPGLELGTRHNDTLHSENCDQGTQVLLSWDQLCHSRVISIASNSWPLSWKPAVNLEGREPHISSILGSGYNVTFGLMKSINNLGKTLEKFLTLWRPNAKCGCVKDKINDASNPLAFVYLRWVKIQKYKINDASNPLALLLTTRESAFSRGALVKHSDTMQSRWWWSIWSFVLLWS